MKYIVVFVAVVGFCLTDAMPINDCRDHYEYCGEWAKGHYCKLKDYRDYMNLVCPYSCGLCDDLLSDTSAFGQATSDTGSLAGSRVGVHRVIPEINADFEGLGSASQQSSNETDPKDEGQDVSGSGDDENEPLFRAPATKETDSRFHGEAEQQDESGDQKEPVSGSGVDPTGANFWAVVRVEPDAVDGGSDRELHLSRRSEKSTSEETTRNADKGSASGAQTSGENDVTQKSELPVKSSSGEEITSGVRSSQRSNLPVTGGSGHDVASGEDDAPFDNSSAESELDSGCSSGDGCYEAERAQGGENGYGNARSVIAKVEQDAIASGSAAASGDSSSNVWKHPHFDVLAGPYDDKVSASGAALLSSGSGSGSVSELGNALHDIEDAIFETGIPLNITRDVTSGSGLPASLQSDSQDESQTSGSGVGGVEKETDTQLFLAPQHHEKMNLMEKMMKLGKLQAFKISHVANVGGTGRDEVPRLDNNDDDYKVDDDADDNDGDNDDDVTVQSDLGQGTKVTFVLNQDFHDGYADDNSAAYNILARNVKKEIRDLRKNGKPKREVERALGSKTVVSEISFSEVREPAHAPRFSKVLTSLKLLGDVTKLEKMVKKGYINSLVVDKKFFHTS